MSVIKNYSFLKLAKLAEDNKKINFNSSSRLSFPASDVLSYVEETGEVELGFMGLTGVDSPLPRYIKSSVFLDKLGHKLYVLFAKAVYKSRHISVYDNYIKNSFGDSREILYKEMSYYFDGIPVIIKEFVPRWIILDSTSQYLGEIILGKRVLVSSCVISIPRHEDHVVIGQWIMR